MLAHRGFIEFLSPVLMLLLECFVVVFCGLAIGGLCRLGVRRWSIFDFGTCKGHFLQGSCHCFHSLLLALGEFENFVINIYHVSCVRGIHRAKTGVSCGKFALVGPCIFIVDEYFYICPCFLLVSFLIPLTAVSNNPQESKTSIALFMHRARLVLMLNCSRCLMDFST